MPITWPHIIEDNFLIEKDFNYFLNFYNQNVKDDGLGISKNKIWLDGNVEGNLSKNFLILFYNNYRQKLVSYLEKLAPERLKLAKWLELNLVWTGKNYQYQIHEDSPNKLLSVVIYLYPEQNIGTILYSDNIGSNKTEIKWLQNRALIFAREEGITWHSYQGDGKSTRYALVVNVRSDV